MLPRLDTSPPSVDLEAARTMLRRAADDFAQSVALHRMLAFHPGLEWTVGDAAATSRSERRPTWATRTAREPWVDVSEIAGGSFPRSNAERLDVEPSPAAALAARVQAPPPTSSRRRMAAPATSRCGGTASRHLARHARPRPGRVTAARAGRGEALDRPWPITPDDARLVLAPALPLLPCGSTRRPGRRAGCNDLRVGRRQGRSGHPGRPAHGRRRRRTVDVT